MTTLMTQNITINIGKKCICNTLNLQIRAGETWGLLGPNASGKTTLLHTLAGLHTSKQGKIFLNADDLHTLSIKTRAQEIGILFQDFQAGFAQTVWEYCFGSRFPQRAYFSGASAQDRQIVTAALHVMELMPLIQQPITQLSGGEKRRLAIACVLAQTPKIYLLDEPTNHLDVRHQMQTLQHFRTLAETQSVAVLMSLHDPNHVQQFCDHVLLLFANGEILQGPVHAILTSENLSRLYAHPMHSMQSGTRTLWYC